MQLVENDRIASALQSEIAKSQVGVYRGQLADIPQSWARIVVFDGMPRGMIWDGAEMYAIEAPGDSTLSIDAPVIYRMADAHVIAGTMSCGADFLSGNAAAIMKLGRHFTKARTVLQRLGLADRAVFVSHASLPNQTVCPLSEAPEKAPYFSMIVVPGKDAHV